MAKIREGATLKILHKTRERLKDAMKDGETYDALFNRLLDKVMGVK